MTIQSFRTNIRCDGCIAKVKPYLDELKEVKSWSVVLESPDRVLTVEGEVSPELIVKALAAAGYAGSIIL